MLEIESMVSVSYEVMTEQLLSISVVNCCIIESSVDRDVDVPFRCPSRRAYHILYHAVLSRASTHLL
jgi:hypothetical protein